jgi:type IV secretory pathway VirB4 component
MGKLILGDLKAVSARIDNEVDKAARKPFTVVVDEFADLATDDFLSFLDRARSAKIGVVVSHQELGDLKRVSEEFARRLMGNTSTLFSFLQKNPDSAENYCGRCGYADQNRIHFSGKEVWAI